MRFRVATYNVHSALGLDRRFSPERIADVIGELDADVIALQEVLSPAHGIDLHAVLRERGFHLVALPTIELAGGTFGNALLSRWPIVRSAAHSLSVASREPRGAIEALLARDGWRLRVIATHLGVRTAERQMQLSRLVDIVRRRPDLPTVLAGDLNVPRVRSRELHACHSAFAAHASQPTFPSIAPVLPLDRVFLTAPMTLDSSVAHASRRARVASDHLPLVATIDVPD